MNFVGYFVITLLEKIETILVQWGVGFIGYCDAIVQIGTADALCFINSIKGYITGSAQ